MSGTFDARINDRELRLTLRNFAGDTGKPEALRAIGVYMVGSVNKTFLDQGSPPHSWAPLKAWTRTGARNRVRFSSGKSTFFKKDARRNNPLAPGRQILILSGRLKNSVTFSVAGSTVLIGSNLVYAGIHQHGGMAGRGHKARIPARPYLVFRPEDPAGIQRVAELALANAAKRAGL